MKISLKFVGHFLICICCILACNDKKEVVEDILSSPETHQTDITELKKPTEIQPTIDKDDQFADYFVVISDTSKNYDTLRRRMNFLERETGLNIDTMGRMYDSIKNLICFPEVDPAEPNMGEYFPRRYPSENLSIEYLKHYDVKSTEKTMAIVVGIYKKEVAADSLFSKLLINHPHAFYVKSHLYMGCLH